MIRANISHNDITSTIKVQVNGKYKESKITLNLSKTQCKNISCEVSSHKTTPKTHYTYRYLHFPLLAFSAPLYRDCYDINSASCCCNT